MTATVQTSGGAEAFVRDVASRVTRAKGSLTPNDSQVIGHLRKHPLDVPFATADSLARDAGVSRAAVVRAARKLGYATFAALRDESRTQLLWHAESPLTRFITLPPGSDHIASIQEKFDSDCRNLAVTCQLVATSLEAAAKAVAAAKNVYVTGSRNSFGLALYLHRLLHGVLPRTHLIDPGFPDEIIALGPEDALVVLLFKRYASMSVRELLRAIRLGAVTVVVTDEASSPFIAGATHILPVSTDTPTLFQSMVAALATLEMLGATIADLNPTESMRLLRAKEELGLEHAVFYQQSRKHPRSNHRAILSANAPAGR